MKTLIVHVGNAVDLSDLECLEQICKKVRLGKLIKFRGKVYRRTSPKNNKVYKYPYHFWCVSQDIYAGSCLTEDADGEDVNTICDYKLVVKLKGDGCNG